MAGTPPCWLRRRCRTGLVVRERACQARDDALHKLLFSHVRQVSGEARRLVELEHPFCGTVAQDFPCRARRSTEALVRRACGFLQQVQRALGHACDARVNLGVLHHCLALLEQEDEPGGLLDRGHVYDADAPAHHSGAARRRARARRHAAALGRARLRPLTQEGRGAGLPEHTLAHQAVSATKLSEGRLEPKWLRSLSLSVREA